MELGAGAGGEAEAGEGVGAGVFGGADSGAQAFDDVSAYRVRSNGDAMIAVLGDSQELTFSFYYQ